MAARIQTKTQALDPERKSPAAEAFEEGLQARVIGQSRAIQTIVSMYQVFRAGLVDMTRPLGSLIFLGPTGSGKTRVIEAAAETLFGDHRAMIKIDCAEFQHSHEIAKLVGSPPGYLGHRETTPLLTQESLDKWQTHENPFSILLFDEIEKSSDALWQLLLGILDKGRMTLGDNRHVDFTRTMIFMTSNLGAKEMCELVEGAIGFAPTHTKGEGADEIDQKIYKTAIEAARRRFSPEFMNRIDRVVVFRRLRREELERILDLELNYVRRRIEGSSGPQFIFNLSDGARELLIREGTDPRYGARHLKRAIERFIMYPLSTLTATKQVMENDCVYIDIDRESDKLIFSRDAVQTGDTIDTTMEESIAGIVHSHKTGHSTGSRIAA